MQINLPDVKLPDVKLPVVRLPAIRVPQVDLSMVTTNGGHRVKIAVDETEIETPPLEHLIYYAGIALLVELSVIEPPVAAVIVAGHLLIGLTRRPGLEALGEVIEEI